MLNKITSILQSTVTILKQTKKSCTLLWIVLVFYAVSQTKITDDYPFFLYHKKTPGWKGALELTWLKADQVNAEPLAAPLPTSGDTCCRTPAGSPPVCGIIWMQL